MNKYSESLIELMAKAMENEFKIPYVQFGDISEIIFDGWENYSYIEPHINKIMVGEDYYLNKAPIWWLHCSILVSLTDEQIEAFKARFVE